ncbi:MAG TPA: ATP-dependent DNA ligase [Pyrinomonadaceae bacterium]|jgi:ATP-dependent DNA ligase|nr:ATP-dependent DNA ligase [Pyrinomonadaceae bacterium]
MSLPLKQPYLPMEAKSVEKLPAGDIWQYEPKWDGFRCIAFRDGNKVDLQSKSGQPLARYFPEVVDALLKLKAKQFVIDGEIVVPIKGKFSFDDLLMRIHPAASRIKKLSQETPAKLIVFDLLVDDRGKSLVDLLLRERRNKLDAFAKKYFAKNKSIELSPCTDDLKIAKDWLRGAGVDLDGVIAKRADMPYQSGNRHGMVKVKRLRTADCVVGGFRYASEGKVVGSLLLGLHDEKGLLHHVGFSSSFKASEKPALTKKLEKLIKPPGFTGNAPGGPSRWATERSAEWKPLAPKLVCEVQYDHFTGGRFRHGTKFLRWRPDKKPAQCTFEQVKR